MCVCVCVCVFVWVFFFCFLHVSVCVSKETMHLHECDRRYQAPENSRASDLHECDRRYQAPENSRASDLHECDRRYQAPENSRASELQPLAAVDATGMMRRYFSRHSCIMKVIWSASCPSLTCLQEHPRPHSYRQESSLGHPSR